jgi:hypothetical protein
VVATPLGFGRLSAKQHHPTIATIHYVPLRSFAQRFRKFSGCHHRLFVTYEAICSSQLVCSLRLCAAVKANGRCENYDGHDGSYSNFSSLH